MKFEKFICWNPQEFKKIVHTEAEASPDDIFLAVHTDNKIKLSVYGNKSKEVSYKKFLDEFLDGDYGNNVQAVIEGESGSGKSHLVQWIRQHIPKNGNKYVLNIPKTQTNLHAVLKKLIQLLPSDKQIEYNTKLQKKDIGLNNDIERKHIFLSALANSILVDKPSEQYNEEEEYLIPLIPNLFNDPYFRDNFFNNHPIINNIISLIFNNSDINRNSDNRQEFLKCHLPLNAANATKAAQPTQEILDAMNDEGLLDIALNIINRNLDKAISRTLNFTPDDLIELMSEIRRYLYLEDKELILLIEDFAQLQGVDTALLQVLTVDGAGELCKIKWAMAVTTGYFEKLEDTVRTRMTFKINMDSLWDKENTTEQDNYILNLASRYLNAVRLGSENISNWYKQYNMEEQTLVPNACDKCPHKNKCQNSFGNVNEIGLYPFNKTALLTMAREADKEKTTIFRPREFLNKVLYRNLNQYTVELLEMGNYPDITLLEDFSTNRLTVEQLHSLEKKDTLNYKRRRTLIELWSNSNQVINLDENIHFAFNLPLLDNLESISEVVPKDINKEIASTVISKPVASPIIDAIENWGKGADLRDNEKNQLSKMLYSAIENNINWDMLPIAKSLATQTVPVLISQRHIYFENQQTRRQTTGIVLDIKCSTENAIVLKTLYKINSEKVLPKDLSSLALFQNKIDEWSNFYIRELINYYDSKENWNATDAAIELLIIESVMCNKDVNIQSLLSDFHDISMASNEFNVLIKNTFSNNSTEKIYQDIIQKTYTGRKGGSKTTSFMDAKKILQIISQFKKNKYRLMQDPSKEDRREFQELANKYSNWQQEFDNALSSELQERFLWIDKLTNKIEIEDIGQAFRNKIKKLQEKLRSSGISIGHTQLDNAMLCNLQQAKNAMENSIKLKSLNSDEIFIELFPSRKDDAMQFLKLIEVYEDYLQTVESTIKSRIDEFHRQSDTKEIVEEINDYINQIDQSLKEIKGEYNAS